MSTGFDLTDYAERICEKHDLPAMSWEKLTTISQYAKQAYKLDYVDNPEEFIQDYLKPFIKTPFGKRLLNSLTIIKNI